MTVDRVIFPFLGEEIGGSHVSCFTLASCLTSSFGIATTIIARRGSLIASEAKRVGLDVVPHDEPATSRNNPVTDLLRLPARRHLLSSLTSRSMGRALLHCNDIGTLQAWIGPARTLGLKAVYHHRSLNRRVLPNTVLIRAADHVICISSETLKSVDFLPPGRATQITNPFAIDSAADRAIARRQLDSELAIDPAFKTIGFVGNFWQRKRAGFFLETAAAMSRRREDLTFVIFGRDGDLTRADLAAEAARLGILDRVRFAGFRLPVEANIAALDLLMLPALREPFGRTPIEAAMLGTPYVATDDAGHGEIARRWKGGALIGIQASPDQFAEAALRAIAAPAALILPRAQREELIQELSPEGHAGRVIAVYANL